MIFWSRTEFFILVMNWFKFGFFQNKWVLRTRLEVGDNAFGIYILIRIINSPYFKWRVIMVGHVPWHALWCKEETLPLLLVYILIRIINSPCFTWRVIMIWEWATIGEYIRSSPINCFTWHVLSVEVRKQFLSFDL